MRESRTLGSVRAKAEWLSYSTIPLTEAEAVNFREYLSRGGFAIFDDFDGEWDWQVFEANMAEVLPGRHFELLEESDPIYQSFFSIEDLDVITHPMGHAYPPMFFGIRDDAGRLQVVANFNNDIGDYWEWSDQGCGTRLTCRTKATSSGSTT